MLRTALWRGFTVCALILSVFAVAAPVAQAQSGDGSSRDSLISVSDIGTVGDYEIAVVDVFPDAQDLIMEEFEFNEPPREGNQFFMVRVVTTYVGSTSGTPWVDLNFQAVGDANVGYTEFDNFCGVIPDGGSATSEIFEGGSEEFNICWQVSSADADSLMMYVSPLISFDESENVWFSLGNASTGAGATPEAGDGLKSTGTALEIIAESSRTEPIPVGSTGQIENFAITVDDVIPVADDLVASENQFNEPPGVGKQFFMVTVTVTNIGEEATMPWVDLNFQAVGDTSVGYTQFDNPCGAIPDSAPSSSEVFPNGTVTFNVCWQIDSADADSLVMYVDSLWSFDDSPRQWFSLQP